MTGFVYRWTNIINNKWYIGSRKGTPGDGYRHSSKILAAAESKYGPENFTREILFEGDYVGDQIKTKEAAYLTKYNAAHNLMSYNQNNMTGPNSLSVEACRKIGKATVSRPAWNKGMKTGPQSKEHKRKRSEAMIGKRQSKEHKRKLSEAMTGKRHSEKTKRKISEALTGVPGTRHTEETKQKIRKSLLGRPSPRKGKILGLQQIITCPYCTKTGGTSNMKRWHLNNCREK